MRVHARDGVDTTTPPPSTDRCGGQLGSVFIASGVAADGVGGLNGGKFTPQACGLSALTTLLG